LYLAATMLRRLAGTLRAQRRCGEQLLEELRERRMEHDPVLVVEDDNAIRESLQYFLVDEGYTVVTARDGQAALEMIPTVPGPTVMLLDLVMPRLD
jgi:PleD family two-component response regulator